jgi:heat shock protein HslJ
LSACSGAGREAPDLDGTQWSLVEMNGETIPEDVEINLSFAEGQISGQSACNRYFAGYEQDGTKLTFDAAGSSQMYCEGLMDIETDYLQALNEVKSFDYSFGKLMMQNKSGDVILMFSLNTCGELSGEAPALDGTQWSLVEMNGEAIPEDLEITIAFDEGLINGQSACNIYFAEYTQDGLKLSIGLAGSSKKYCEGLMDLEAKYLQALSEVKSFDHSFNELIMKNQSGEVILVFSLADLSGSDEEAQDLDEDESEEQKPDLDEDGSAEEAPDLSGTAWSLVEMNGEAIPEDTEITIAFSGGAISGQSTCNQYFAGYTQEGNSLVFDQAGRSNMYCDGLMIFEDNYLQALSEVKNFQLKNNTMTMKDKSGTAILVFSK